MHVKKVTLHNIGLHRHTEQTFQRGLVGIFGRNGSGKSTMVNAIYAGFTNDFNRFHGVKADLIRDLAGPKEKSYIEVEAEHDGVGFTIHRSLRPNASELMIDGMAKPITAAKDIEVRLQKDLGVDMKVIGTYVFVDQWHMFDFVDHTPAVRAEAFNHLCRTDKAKAIYKACDAMLGDNELSREVTDNSDELVTQIGETDLQIEKLAADRQQHERALISDKAKRFAEKTRKKRDRHNTYLEEMDEAEKDEPNIRKKVAIRKKKYGRAKEETRRAKMIVEANQEDVDAAKAALSNWDTYDQRRKRRGTLLGVVADLNNEETENPEPKEPAEYSGKSKTSAFIANARAKKKQAQQVVATFEETSKGICPTCLQPIDVEFVRKQQQEIRTCDNVLKDLGPKFKACEDFEAAHKKWFAWRSGWSAKLKAAQEELATLANLKEPKGNREALKEKIKEGEVLQNAYELAVEAESTANARWLKGDGVLKALEKHIETLETKITKTQVPNDLYDRVTKKLALHEYATLEIATLDGQLKELKRKRDEAQKSLDNLRAVLKRRKRLKRAMNLLTKVRDVFHWNNLPWKVAQGNLASMEEDINNRLTWLGDPFWAEADENLTFKIHFPGRPSRPAVDLSGGQRGIFAVAFRCGVGDVFGADIGMMFLDEPTAGLDSENVTYFQEALNRLAAEVRGKRQIVVITHAVELSSAFDQVIYCGDPDLTTGD